MLELLPKTIAWSHLARQCDGALTLVAPIVATNRVSASEISLRIL
jgi:hypothetical protein